MLKVKQEESKLLGNIIIEIIRATSNLGVDVEDLIMEGNKAEAIIRVKEIKNDLTQVKQQVIELCHLIKINPTYSGTRLLVPLNNMGRAENDY